MILNRKIENMSDLNLQTDDVYNFIEKGKRIFYKLGNVSRAEKNVFLESSDRISTYYQIFARNYSEFLRFSEKTSDYIDRAKFDLAEKTSGLIVEAEEKSNNAKKLVEEEASFYLGTLSKIEMASMLRELNYSSVGLNLGNWLK